MWSKCVYLCPLSCLFSGQQSMKTWHLSIYWEWNTECSPLMATFTKPTKAQGILRKRRQKQCTWQNVEGVLRNAVFCMWHDCHTHKLTVAVLTCKTQTYIRPSQPKSVHKQEKGPVLFEELLAVDVCWGIESLLWGRGYWWVCSATADGSTPIQLWTERIGISGIEKEKRSKRNNKEERGVWYGGGNGKVYEMLKE